METMNIGYSLKIPFCEYTFTKWEEKMVQEKFKKIVLILPILALLVLFCTVMVSYRSGASVSDYKRVYTLYQVQYGDTAYGLASENKYPGMDSRDYIMELNEVNSGIDLFEDPLYYGSYLLIVKYVPK